MRIAYFLAWFFCALIGLNANNHAYGGVPSGNAYLVRNSYIIEYDFEHKIPRWVAYYVKPSYLNAPEREGVYDDFSNDPDIVGEAKDADYERQFNTWRNYVKGHLVPCYISGGDRDDDGLYAIDGDSDDQKTVFEVNYMSSIAPQHHYEFNTVDGLWYKLETYVRENLLIEQQKDVWVFAGCILGPSSYDRIGNNVEVPPMFYKIIITEESGEPIILAFLFPHQIIQHGEIDDFLVSVNIIESLTGLDFFSEIENEEQIERNSTWDNWSP